MPIVWVTIHLNRHQCHTTRCNWRHTTDPQTVTTKTWPPGKVGKRSNVWQKMKKLMSKISTTRVQMYSFFYYYYKKSKQDRIFSTLCNLCPIKLWRLVSRPISESFLRTCFSDTRTYVPHLNISFSLKSIAMFILLVQ